MPLILTPLDLNKNELQNARVQNLSTAPSTPVTGQLYYDTDDNRLYYWTGTVWRAADGSSVDFGEVGDIVASAPGDTASAGATGEVADAAHRHAREAHGLTEHQELIAAADLSDVTAKSGTGTVVLFQGSPTITTPTIASFEEANHNHTNDAGGGQLALSSLSDHNAAAHQELLATNDLTDWPRVASLDLNTQKIINLAAPTGANDAARLVDIQNAAAGLAPKDSVRAATTAAGTLATDFDNGSLVDGVTLTTGDRILIKNQSSGSENGIYLVVASGTPTRATDFDSQDDARGALIPVEEGSTNGNSVWMHTTDTPFTIDTTALVFTQFGAGTLPTAGAGLTLTGSTLDVGAGTGVTVNANDVAVDTAVVVRKYSETIGDGAATSYVLTHNLGTKDITVAVRRVSDDVHVIADPTSTSTTTATITFAVAPTTNQYRVTIHG